MLLIGNFGSIHQPDSTAVMRFSCCARQRTPIAGASTALTLLSLGKSTPMLLKKCVFTSILGVKKLKKVEKIEVVEK